MEMSASTTTKAGEDNDNDAEFNSDKSEPEEGAPVKYKFVPCRKQRRRIGDADDDWIDNEFAEVEIMAIGDSGVGKTSILKRIAERKWDPDATTTIGLDFISVWVMSNAPAYDRKTNVSLVDTQGQDRFYSVVKQRLRSPFGFFMIFDATDRKSFDALTRWSTCITEAPNDFACRMLVANKIDAYNQLDASKKWMNTLNWDAEADRLKCDEGFFCVSARDGDNIDSMFAEMVDYALERQEEIEQEVVASDAKPKTRAARAPVINITNKVTNYSKNKNTCQC